VITCCHYWLSLLVVITGCHYLLSFRAECCVLQFATQKIKIQIYKNIILRVVLYGCETWLLTLSEELRLGMFDNNRVLRETG
jgi:hypothetical protein